MVLLMEAASCQVQEWWLQFIRKPARKSWTWTKVCWEQMKISLIQATNPAKINNLFYLTSFRKRISLLIVFTLVSVSICKLRKEEPQSFGLCLKVADESAQMIAAVFGIPTSAFQTVQNKTFPSSLSSGNFFVKKWSIFICMIFEWFPWISMDQYLYCHPQQFVVGYVLIYVNC